MTGSGWVGPQSTRSCLEAGGEKSFGSMMVKIVGGVYSGGGGGPMAGGTAMATCSQRVAGSSKEGHDVLNLIILWLALDRLIFLRKHDSLGGVNCLGGRPVFWCCWASSRFAQKCW